MYSLVRIQIQVSNFCALPQMRKFGTYSHRNPRPEKTVFSLTPEGFEPSGGSVQLWYRQLIYDSEMEYKKYRVKTTIKSFRDLEVYQRTTALSAELFTLNPPDGTHNKHLENELEVLKELSKYVPKYIAESYGDRYSDKTLGIKKQTESNVPRTFKVRGTYFTEIN